MIERESQLRLLYSEYSEVVLDLNVSIREMSRRMAMMLSSDEVTIRTDSPRARAQKRVGASKEASQQVRDLQAEHRPVEFGVTARDLYQLY